MHRPALRTLVCRAAHQRETMRCIMCVCTLCASCFCTAHTRYTTHFGNSCCVDTEVRTPFWRHYSGTNSSRMNSNGTMVDAPGPSVCARSRNNHAGYRLTFKGYDVLALRALTSRGKVVAVCAFESKINRTSCSLVCGQIGNQIGVGKESDIFLAQVQSRFILCALVRLYVYQDADGNEIVLKLHRLGRISFRSVRKNRDYLRHRQSANWLYMSRYVPGQ
jgi:hypothetical protein